MKVRDKENKIDIKIGNIVINQDSFNIIAGPCSVENKEMLEDIVINLKDIEIIRGGAYKPRTSPYAFQGLGKEGINYLVDIKQRYNKLIVSEIMSIDQIEHFKNIDIIQIGARNMQNFELLKVVARLNKPILLKRGLGNTIEEFISSAEYIFSEGNNQVIMCERGIRTFETQTRFTLDIAAIDLIKEQTNLPIFIDPSHASGNSKLVKSLALAATAAGCNGLLIEVHNDPKCALSDADQQLTYDQFKDVYTDVLKIKNALK